jgi:16S rRNA (guanine966-N2)-methyltransferase
MGLEALSRGAQRAVFCDRSPKAAETIRQNILKLPLLEQSKAKVLKLELPRQWSALENQGPFSLFLLDPPYDDLVSAKVILSKAIQSALTANQAAAVWEQAPESLKKWEAGDFSPWELKTTRSWGRRAAAIFTLTKFTQADTEPPENE